MEHNNSHELIHFIKEATSPYHVVKTSVSILEDAGFEKLNITKEWNLEKGKSYYTVPYGSALFAFKIPDNLDNSNFRIAAAHTDHPCLRIKPVAEIYEGDYLRIDTEYFLFIVNPMIAQISLRNILFSPEQRHLSVSHTVWYRVCRKVR